MERRGNELLLLLLLLFLGRFADVVAAAVVIDVSLTLLLLSMLLSRLILLLLLNDNLLRIYRTPRRAKRHETCLSYSSCEEGWTYYGLNASPGSGPLSPPHRAWR